MSAVNDVLAHADADLDRSRERLFALLRIPSDQRAAGSCGGLPRVPRNGCARPAAGLGFERRRCARPRGIPWWWRIIPGRRLSRAASPVLWPLRRAAGRPGGAVDTARRSSRNSSKARTGQRVVARGAVDDKGQLMMLLEASAPGRRTPGRIPARITVLIEGEEEIGSRQPRSVLCATIGTSLRGELALITDTGMWDIDTPAITTRLRGMVYTQVTLKAANRDLHSGLYRRLRAEPDQCADAARWASCTIRRAASSFRVSTTA